MDYRNSFIFTTPLLAAMLLLMVHFIPVHAESTLEKYCSNGVCSTGGSSKPITNSSIGIYAPGLYNGPNALALKNAQRIGIVLSKTCIIMEQHNMTTNCLTYDKLKFLDNTKPEISGDWLNDTWYHRGPPHVKDAYRFYNGSVIIEVDPDGVFASKALMITVVDKNFTWINPDDISNGGIVTLTHINRSVLNCDQATVAPILPLINDTVYYLKSGCTNTSFNDTQINYHTDIPFSMDNPYSSLKQQYFLKQYGITLSGESHLRGGHTMTIGNCITHKCDIKDPYLKPNWGK